MSYGQDKPWGLQAIETQSNSSWNGQMATYLIESGYGQNIFKGDPVYIDENGYLRNLFDLRNAPPIAGQSIPGYANSPAIGIFNGCQYIVPTAVSPVDPASPGRPFWPANTRTLGNAPAVADVIIDPTVLYNAQVTGNVGATQNSCGKYAYVTYQETSPGSGIVAGNTNTGQSYVSINIESATRTTDVVDTVPVLNPIRPSTYAFLFNCYIDSLSADSRNVSGQLYNNVQVLINNHYFRVMRTLI